MINRSGSGSVWGTIEQQWPLPKKELPELPPVPPKAKPESKPNFLTKPPKRGTGYGKSLTPILKSIKSNYVGYPNVTIGKSYEYVSDPYDLFLEAIKVRHLNVIQSTKMLIKF
jgi:hypothetical protein